jgi:hypothetical protein
MIASLRKISWYLVVRLLLFSLVIRHGEAASDPAA